MKKRLITLALSVVLAAVSVGAVPVFAAETAVEEAVPVEEEVAEEQGVENEEPELELAEIGENDVSLDSDDVFVEEPVQIDEDEIAEAKDESISEVDNNAEPDESVDVTEIDENADYLEDASAEEVIIEDDIESIEENKATGEVVASGTCGEQGDNLTWELDDGGTLTISGTGRMKGYEFNANRPAPWYSFREQIISAVIQTGVTSISQWAFTSCNKLTSVTIPSSVTSIGGCAFNFCRSLTSVVIPNGISAIGYATFNECSSLKSVIIPPSVTTIYNHAFYGCTSLENVTIPSSVTSIGEWAFNGCASLKSVTIPNSITTIETCTFASCTSLTSVTIPNSVTCIGENAFSSCASITSVTIPSSVTSIGNAAFYGCTSITSVTIPSSVTSIGNYSFKDCTGLTSVTIPNSVKSGGSSVFAGCTGLTSVTIPPGMTSIWYSAFSGCTNLTSVTIPSSVTDIRNEAFKDCTGLMSVSIPSSVTNIGSSVFSGCTGLTSMAIPSNVMNIGNYAFKGCTGLTSVSIPDGVTKIRYAAFSGCTSLTSVIIPGSVTNIGGHAFFDCSDLIVYTTNDYVISYCKSYRYKCNYAREFSPRINTVHFDYTLPIRLYFDKEITGNNGHAYLYKAGIEEPVESILLDESYVGGHSVTLKDLWLEFKSIECGKNYYITIDEDALELYDNPDDDSNDGNVASAIVYYPFSGISKNAWEFSTTELEYVPFTNPNLRKNADEISKRLFQNVFKAPIVADDLYEDEKYRLPGGICYGMSYASGANMNNWDVIRKFGELYNYTDKSYKEKTPGYDRYTLYEYMKMANIYQLKYNQEKEIKDTKNKYADIVGCIRSNKQVIISIWNKESDRHAVLPLSIIEETSEEIKVVVYDCNGNQTKEEVPDFRRTTFLHTLTFYKNGSEISGFEYKDGNNVDYNKIAINTLDPEFESLISVDPNAIYDPEKVRAQYESEYEGHPLLWLSDPSHIDDIVRTVFPVLTAYGDEKEDQNNNYYWIEGALCDGTLTADNSISITDGFDKIEVSAGAGASISLDIKDNTAKIKNSNAVDKNYIITHTCAEDEDTIKSIVIKGETSSTINTDSTDSGIIVSNEDDAPIEAVVSITENDEEVNTLEVNAATNSVNVTYDENETLTIWEDTDSDGTYETVVATTDEQPTEKEEQKLTVEPAVAAVVVGRTADISVTGAQGALTFEVEDSSVATATVSGTKVTVTGKKAGSTKIKVKAAENADYKAAETEVELSVLPGKTTRGDMFNLANNVKVTWKEVPGAKYYKVYREGITDKKETQKEPVIVTERLIGWDQQPGLTNGHAYRYKIVASLTGKGDSSGDSPLSYSKVMYRLKTVVIRSVKNTAPGKVTIKYDKTTCGDSYVLQYGERQDMVGAKTKVVLGANKTSYTIGGLKKGKTYYISIRVRKKVNGIDYYTTFGVPKKVTVTK